MVLSNSYMSINCTKKTVKKEWRSPYLSGEKPFLMYAFLSRIENFRCCERSESFFTKEDFVLRKLSIMFWRKPGHSLNEDRENKRLGDVRRLIFKSNVKQVEERNN
ncbi:hypothetical protein YC2023_054638 [Brassica napus]